MSWDIFVQDLPADAQTVEAIPNDFRPAPIGKRADIIAIIQAIIPFADFSDPSWGRIQGDGISIEVSLGRDEEIDGFALFVRGNRDAAVGIIADILDHLGLRALDGGSPSGFFDRETSLESLRRWRAYRDHVVK